LGRHNEWSQSDAERRTIRPIYVHSESDPSSIGGNIVRSLSLDSNGFIWAATWDGGVSQFDPNTKRFRVFRNIAGKPNSLSSDRTTSISTDRQGSVWVGTYDTGLERYDPIADGFIHHRSIPNDPSSLPSDEVQSLLPDVSGTLWIGTSAGVANINPYRQKFPLLKLPDNVPAAFYNQVQALCVDRHGDLWCGTRGGGLVHIPKGTKNITRYVHSEKDPGSLSNDFVSAVYEQRDGSLWIGTHGGGLNRFNPRTGKFRRMMTDGNDSGRLSAKYIICLLETSDGSLWVGTEGDGISRRNSATGVFRHYRSIDGDSSSISSNFVYSFLEDKRKNLWVGTWGSDLDRFDPKEQRFIHYRHRPGDSTSLAARSVFSMAEDRDGKIWIGTPDGLSCFDHTTNRFTTFAGKNGIANPSINSIAVDRHHSVWVATNLGVSKFDTQTNEFKNYTVSDGLQGLEFQQGVSATDASGRMYFGGSGGINIFHPDSVRDNPFVPPVHITRFNVLEQPFPFSSGAKMGITLEDDQNFISFEYAALDYSASERNSYSYMLEGVDADWSRPGTRRFASYPNLSPGTYTFRVRGSNNDGVWNLDGASMSITITPPYWMTWWFRSIVLLGFLSIGPIVYIRRVQQLKTEKERQEDFSRQLIDSQEDERKRIASELHDSIGQNLLYIKNSAVLGKNKNDLNRFSDISETASSSIDEIRRITYDLFPYQLDRMGLTKAIESVVRRTGESSGIDCRCVTDNIDGVFSTEKGSSLFRIIQESMNNIIKHSGAKHASVAISRTENEVRIVIGDDGRGFNAELVRQESKGFGLKNIQNRVSLLSGKIMYTESPEYKTLITMTFPLSNE
jgi:signal transduction histidine kinase/streptogramin lyase